MKTDDLKNKPIMYLRGVGEARAKCFSRLGIKTAYDLLFHYPRSYEDWSHPYTVLEAPVNEVCAIAATIAAPVSESHLRRDLTVFRTAAFDDTAQMGITIFGSRYAAERLRTGKDYIFYGKPEGSMNHKMLVSPKFIEAKKAPPMFAIYPSTEGLSQGIFKKTVDGLLSEIGNSLDDPLPAALRETQGLCDLSFALHNIHSPESVEALTTARKRLVFEEFFYLQLGLRSLKMKTQESGIIIKNPDCSAFFSALPYELTSAQKRCIGEAVGDMSSGKRMNRLLQGDVGSGKTAVAAALVYVCAENGFQSALMAPTEVLAAQHYKTLCSQLAGFIPGIALLTGSTTAAQKKDILRRLACGEIQLIIGTHALIESGVEFSALGLVITDEQHRFGVEQRGILEKKSSGAHVLVMSATPIPRTLSFIMYGDLDVSIIDEMPRGRRPVKTFHVTDDYHPRIYNFIRKQVTAGHQVYVVCPLIEENESELVSVGKISDKYRRIFPDLRIGLLHGRMKGSDKDAVMLAFAAGEYDILISTTVIEVGVDVPNATLIIVENAERFGLSQLHQLRGRVGRGDAESYCVLFSDAKNDVSVQRLTAMTKTCDGFKIAETDLALRGPGDFFGRRQHGLPLLRIADLFVDMDIMKKSGDAASEMLSRDPTLSLPENLALRERIETLFNSVFITA